MVVHIVLLVVLVVIIKLEKIQFKVELKVIQAMLESSELVSELGWLLTYLKSGTIETLSLMIDLSMFCKWLIMIHWTLKML